MENTISKKISAEASAAKPLVKPTPGDKSLGLDTDIWFYAIEDIDDHEEGEEVEIFVVYDSSLAASKQNLVKRKFTYIYTFDHEGPAFIIMMRDLTAVVCEHLEITYTMDVEKRLAYKQLILRGAALKNYQDVLVTCTQSAKEPTVDEWTLGKLTGISAEDILNWAKTDTTGYDGHDYLDQDKCGCCSSSWGSKCGGSIGVSTMST